MGKSKPKAPDPYKTADAQAAANRETAITQQELNMINQAGPWGSVSYQQTGTTASGTPQWSQTTSLSPSQQAIFDQSQAAQQNLAGIAAQQTGFLQNYLQGGLDTSGLPALQSDLGMNTNFNGDLGLQTGLGLQTSYAGADDFSADRQRVEDALWQRTAADRMQADDRLRSTLAAKGIQEGSAAWNAEMERMGRQEADARLATILAGGQEQSRLTGLARDAAMFGNDARLAEGTFGNAARATQGQFGMAAQQAGNAALAQQGQFNNAARQQGLGEAVTLRNQPINEALSIMGGSQVQNPAGMMGQTPNTGVAGVDLTGLVNNQYNQQMQQYQSGMGGLFGLGSSLLGAAGNAGGFAALFSDERLKTDIRKIGQTDGGTNIYSYRYIWGGPVQFGVMAQEVPHAAIEHPSGYLMVDYGKVA